MLKTLRRIFTIRMPDEAIYLPNPIYTYEQGRTRRGFTDRRIRQLLFILPLPFILIPVLFAIPPAIERHNQYLQWMTQGPLYPSYYSQQILLTFAPVITQLLLVTFIFMLISEALTLLLAIRTRDIQRDDNHWSTLR